MTRNRVWIGVANNFSVCYRVCVVFYMKNYHIFKCEARTTKTQCKKAIILKLVESRYFKKKNFFKQLGNFFGVFLVIKEMSDAYYATFLKKSSAC
jgi:hypothetical protein